MERYIKKSRKHSHLSIEERGMTDGFLMLGMSISRIAAHLNRSESTISEEMHEALIRNAKKININTITYDNGTENALHETTSKLFGRSNLFCRLYCGKDKGSIENRNKILRQFLRGEGTNFDLISNKQIRTFQNQINNRPMKLLK